MMMKKQSDTGEDQLQDKSEKVFRENAEKCDIWHLVEWQSWRDEGASKAEEHFIVLGMKNKAWWTEKEGG